MSKTVVGIFENERDGQNAQNYLLANGFGDGDVDIKTATYKSAPSEPAEEHNQDLFDRIGHFFKELFSGDEAAITQHVEAGKHGTIVTVHATSLEEAQQAMQILDEFGAINVNQRISKRTEGAEYEDPIVNPPSVAEGPRSRVVDRKLEENYRLREQLSQDNQPPLNKTIAERDALLGDILNNDLGKSDTSAR